MRDGSLVDAAIRAEDSSVNRDAGPIEGRDSSSEAATHKLCDGSSEIRVYAARTPTGKLELGGVPVYVNIPELVLDGTCTLYIIPSELRELRSKHLDDSEEQALIKALKIDSWRSAEGDYCTFASDGPRDVYWVDRVWLSNGPCRGPELPPELGWRLVADYINSQYDSAAAVGDDVWYTVVKDGSAAGANSLKDSYFRRAPAWPLEGDPDALATMEDGRVPLYRVDGMVGQSLRDLRSRVIHGSIGSIDALYLPIEQPDGSRYQLRIRDVTPFDGPEGPAVILPK